MIFLVRAATYGAAYYPLMPAIAYHGCHHHACSRLLLLRLVQCDSFNSARCTIQSISTLTSRGCCALPRDAYQRHRNIEYQAATPCQWTWRLLSDLSLVEGQLITFQDVAVTSTALAGSR